MLALIGAVSLFLVMLLCIIALCQAASWGDTWNRMALDDEEVQAIVNEFHMKDQAILTTVVVVDDEPSVVRVVCDVLDDAGIAVQGCAFGAAAYPYIRTQQPKVVLLDIQMPMVDGIQVFRQLRADPLTAQIPVIFLTANAHVLYAEVPNFLAMGATLLPKPFNVVSLVSQVRQRLKYAP